MKVQENELLPRVVALAVAVAAAAVVLVVVMVVVVVERRTHCAAPRISV